MILSDTFFLVSCILTTYINIYTADHIVQYHLSCGIVDRLEAALYKTIVSVGYCVDGSPLAASGARTMGDQPMSTSNLVGITDRWYRLTIPDAVPGMFNQTTSGAT